MRERVLIVDDELPMRTLLGRVVRALGHDVLEVGDGTDALHLIEQEHPALVILDLFMPGMDGIELIQRLRAMDAAVQPKIIAISGGGRTASEMFLKFSERLGADAALHKPFSLAQLEQTVQRLLPVDEDALDRI